MTISDALYVAGAIIVSLGGGAVIVIGLSSWLGKLWAKRILQKESAEFERLTHEHNTRFSSIHAKQAELIAELYGLLHKLRDGVKILKSSADDDWLGMAEDNGWNLKGKAIEAEKFYAKNRIYFSDELCRQMEDFVAVCDRVSEVYLSAHYCEVPEEKQKKMASARELLQQTLEKTNKALEQMVADFRALLGVPN
jgi:hypothetical protein